MNLGTRGHVTVALFHSMFGLRPVELDAADRLRAAGHRVVTPDLFAGAVAAEPGAVPTMDNGFALMERIGWDTIMARARAAVHDLPPNTVLAGFSMGVGVVGSLCR
jgi:dienelactone hydrolase